MKTKFIYLIILVVIGGGVYVGLKSFRPSHEGHEHGTAEHKKALYFCPMHPNITSDKPGRCPICGMDLQKADDTESEKMPTVSSEEKPKKEKKLLFYRHPMNPKVTSPTPAKDEMGMDYIAVYEEDVTEGGSSDVAGRASFPLSKEKQKLIGVTSTQAVLRELSTDVRASGKVAFDPDLFTAIEEYRQALQSKDQMGKSMFKDLREDAQQLVTSSETKLKLLGLTDSQIQALADKKTDPMSLLLPKGKVWIYAEVFEYEMSGLKQGQELQAEAPALPGKTFTGTISSISPILNTPTRTFRVRGEVPDPEGVLRPDTFVNVKIKMEFGKRLAVPLDSVLHSGDNSFVFVVKDQGVFEPRMVKVGVKTQEYYEILSGVSEGETVVTGANFLVDSESRLRNALKNIQGGRP